MMSSGQEKRAAVAAWLNAQGIRNPETVSSDEHAELLTLLAPHKGFGIFWSMLMFERQSAVIALANARLGSPEADSAAGQLQGFIKSVDAWRELLLTIADPIGEGSEAED
jgi:hypothetical protein